MLPPFDIGYQTKVMGCACSKTHAHTATEQVKRGRATLQLDLSASSPQVERVGTVPNQKKVRTPAVTPRSVATLDSASERTRRPRSITEYGIFVSSTFACEVPPAVGVKTPRNRSVSTADISTESDSDDNIGNEDSNEGDDSRGEGACKDAVEHMTEPKAPRSLEDSEGCSNKARRLQEGTVLKKFAYRFRRGGDVNMFLVMDTNETYLLMSFRRCCLFFLIKSVSRLSLSCCRRFEGQHVHVCRPYA